MKSFIKSTITVGITAVTLILSALSAQASAHSHSKDLVVIEPRDLPEPAQLHGNSLLLHTDNEGETYLYVEQQQGAHLSVFDVTDPSHIKLAVSTQIPNEGAFDFIRPLGEDAELVYFRDGQRVGVLDLHQAKKPMLRTIAASADLATAEQLGKTTLLTTNIAYRYVPAVARDVEIVDISSADPTPLATIKDVKHRVTNDDTGTSFLLGSEGLTVVRRVSVENDYKIQQMQTRGN